MIIGLNKSDAVTEEELEEKRNALTNAASRPVMTLAGFTGDGVKDVLVALWDVVKEDIAKRAMQESLDEEQPASAESEWSPL